MYLKQMPIWREDCDSAIIP